MWDIFLKSGMKYTTTATNAAVEVTKALEITASGAGRIGYRLSTTRSAPVTVTVIDRIETITAVQIPATDHARWTLTGSTLEYHLSIAPDQPKTTAIRFHTDDPETVADIQCPPQLDVIGPNGSANAARSAEETGADTSTETGGFEFPHGTGGADRSDEARPRADDANTQKSVPPREGSQSSLTPAAVEPSDIPTGAFRLDQESEFSMPDDEYTEAELIAAGANPSTDE